jgi:hypothetical protein
MGTGGAPEGVLTAAAMRCLNGEIFARLVIRTPEDEERCRAMGITDLKKIYLAKDLAPGSRVIFAATGVTDGTLMRGVRFFGEGVRTSSVIMQNDPHYIRFIDSIHVAPAETSRSASSHPMLRIIVSAAAPDPASIGRAAAVLRAGGIAAVPTDTLYGLAADPFNPAAVSRLFTIKDREAGKAIPLVAAGIEQVLARFGLLPPLAERLAGRFWPGPLTLVLRAPPSIANEVTGGGGTVGVRVPAHDVTLRAVPGRWCAADGDKREHQRQTRDGRSRRCRFRTRRPD